MTKRRTEAPAKRYISASNRLLYRLEKYNRTMLILYCIPIDSQVKVNKKTLRDRKGVRYTPID